MKANIISNINFQLLIKAKIIRKINFCNNLKFLSEICSNFCPL